MGASLEPVNQAARYIGGGPRAWWAKGGAAYRAQDIACLTSSEPPVKKGGGEGPPRYIQHPHTHALLICAISGCHKRGTRHVIDPPPPPPLLGRRH